MKTKNIFWTNFWKLIILFSLLHTGSHAQDYVTNYPINIAITNNTGLNRIELTAYDSILQSVVSYNSPWVSENIFITGNSNGKVTFTYWNGLNQTDQLGVIVYDMILHEFFLNYFDISNSQSQGTNIVCGPNWVEMMYEFDGGGWYGYIYTYMRYNLFLHKWVSTSGIAPGLIRFANTPAIYNLPQIGNGDRLVDEDDYSFIYYDPVADKWQYFISSNVTNYLEEDNFYGNSSWPDTYYGLQTYDPRTHKLEQFERANLETQLFDGVFISQDIDSTFKHFFTIYDIGSQQWISDSMFTSSFTMLQSKNRILSFVSDSLGVKQVFSMVYNPVLHAWIKDSVVVSGNITNLQINNGTVSWNDTNGSHVRGYDQTLGWGNYATSILMNFELIDFTGQGYPFIYVKNYSIGTDSVYFDFGDGTVSANNRNVLWHQYTASGNYNVCIFDSSGTQSSCQSALLTLCNYFAFATVNADTLCAGDSAHFSVTGNFGSLQWQRKEGSVWIDIIAQGSDQSAFTYSMDSSLLVRAKLSGVNCIPSYSNELLVFVNRIIGSPVVSDTLFHKCSNSYVRFSISGTSPGIQWQWQAGNGITWSNISGTFPNPNINNNNNWIRCKLTSGNCFIDTSIVVQQIISSTPAQLPVVTASRCGPGLVTLQTTASGTALWYDNTGKILLGEGDTIETNVTANTTLKVVDSDGPISKLGYEDNSIGTIATDTLTGVGMRIYVQEPCYLQSIKVYPTNSGSIYISIRTPNGITVFGSLTMNVSNNPQGEVISLNTYLNGLQTYDIFIIGVNQSVFFQYNTSGINYPISTPGNNVSILGYVDSVFHNTPDLYQFYDLNIVEGCRSPVTNVNVTVYPTPSVTIAAIGQTVFCRGDSVKINAYPISPSYQYSWMQNGSIIPGATNTYYMVKLPGSYQAIVMNTNCPDTSTSISVRTPCISLGQNVQKVDLNNDEPEQLCTVHLDNFQNQLVVDIKSTNAQLIQISCFDELGRLVISDLRSIEAGNNTITNNFDKYENGIYLVKIWTNSGAIVKKVAKLY